MAGVKRAAVLVKNCRHKVCAELDAAAIGRKRAGQQVQQCGFARPIGADKRNAFAALNAHGKIAHDAARTEGFADIACLNHQRAGFRGRFKFHCRHARTANLRRAFGAQIGQAAHAAHIALAPRRNAFNRPAAFGLDQPVQLVALLVFFLENLVTPFLEMAEATVHPAHLPTIDPKNVAGQRAQKRAVMADQHKGFLGRGEFFLQPFDHVDIKVVGLCRACAVAPSGIISHAVRRIGDHQMRAYAPQHLRHRCCVRGIPAD